MPAYPIIQPSVTVIAGDLEIGAMEWKDATLDVRAKVAAPVSISESDVAGAIYSAIFGVTTGSALDADGAGTFQQYLRGLLKAFLARVAACNTGAIAGTVTANAGTNLNTSTLALEAGGHLASIDTKVTTCNTGAIAGAVTANAGTNLNTSGLALESTGNLAAAATVLGVSTGAAVVTDADGKIQQYLRGLVKTLIPVSGAITGAAVVTDADGSIQQYLRGLVSIFADIWDTTNHLLNVTISSRARSAPVPQPRSMIGATRPFTNIDPNGNLQVRAQVLTDEGEFGDDFNGAALATALTGTLTFINGSTTVVGVGTLFTTELTIDHYIKANAHAETCWAKIASISDNTHLVLETAYTGAGVGGAASSKQNWTTLTGAACTIGVANSLCTLTQDTANGLVTGIYRDADYAPVYSSLSLYLTARRANQSVFAGFKSGTLAANVAGFVFSGVSNYYVICRSSSSGAAADTQDTTVLLPGDSTTAVNHSYEVRIYNDKVLFYIDDLIVAVHRRHLPQAYDLVQHVVEISNSGIAAGATAVVVDDVRIDNMNRMDVVVTQPAGSKLQTTIAAECIPINCNAPLTPVAVAVGTWVALSAGLTAGARYELIYIPTVPTDEVYFYLRDDTAANLGVAGATYGRPCRSGAPISITPLTATALALLRHPATAFDGTVYLTRIDN